MVHVVSSVKFAIKAVAAGVDAVVAEGFEAGGHNGREETTTMVLIPMVREAIDVPLIAAGGIATGSAMLAAMCLGADGVQVGSRFVCSEESSAHLAFKQRVADAGEGETLLTLKELAPVRLLRNKFQQDVLKAYASWRFGAGPEGSARTGTGQERACSKATWRKGNWRSVRSVV